MSHFILDILKTASYPFATEAPPGAANVIRDAHVMWWTSCSCVQITATAERVFIVFRCTKGAESKLLYADISLPFSENTVPLADADGVEWGWVFPGAAPETAISLTGNYALSPFVTMPSESPVAETAAPIGVSVEGGVTIDVDPDTNHITFNCREELYTRNPDYQTEAGPLGEKDAGIYRFGGAKGEEISLFLEDGTVYMDGDNKLLLVPDFSVTITDAGVPAVHIFKLASVDAGSTDTTDGYAPAVYTYTSDTAPLGTIFTVTDDALSLKGAFITYNGVSGNEGDDLSSTDGITIVARQLWEGCGTANPLVDGLVCSKEDGSVIPYPLDGEVCIDASCPPVWERQ